MLEELLNKEKSISVIGLGYVGLPIALAFARKVHVVGFDINNDRIDLMKRGIDPSDEIDAVGFEGADIHFTSDPEDLKNAHFHIVAVPTPVDKHNVPYLKPLLAASEAVGNALKPGDYVVFESTVYPGCTEEDCVPVLERASGLKLGKDFKVGFSPERINPGDKEHTLERITKVISGSDAKALEVISAVYATVVTAGVHKAASIKVAEAAKIIENTQRDLNIALMNELSKIFDRLGINTYDVLESAGTKWNFLPFVPGFVGGHCIGVDPYYLTYKAAAIGYEPEVILSGRHLNDGMARYVAGKIVQRIIQIDDQPLKKSRVLVMGITFKENVSDIRNSKVADLVKELQAFALQVDLIDPHADKDEVKQAYGLEMAAHPDGTYDAIVVAVSHSEYAGLDETYFKKFSKGTGILIDPRGIYRNKVVQMDYWSL